MNIFLIILSFSIAMEIVIYFGTLKYLKSFSDPKVLLDFQLFYKDLDADKNIEDILKERAKESIRSAKSTLFFSILGSMLAIYLNQNSISIYILAFMLILVSLIKYFLINRYTTAIINDICSGDNKCLKK